MDLRQLSAVNSVTEPVIKESRHTGNTPSAKEWLDALSSGACDQEVFFSGVSGLLRKAPDAGWDLLALLDQYYRRGKISGAVFTALNSRLRGLVMRAGPSGDSSVPLPGLLGDEPTAGISAAPQSTPAALPDEPAKRAAPDPARGRPPRSIAVGDVLRDRYRVQGVLGQGGMGTVFAAVDQYRLDGPHGDQLVALKVLHTEVIKRPRLFAELRREFQHLQSLSHPNIVRVHEFDRDGDLAFFTMEHLSGVLLSRVVSAQESAALYRPYALAFIRDIGAAVAYAHARGVVHGDLYPGNVFVTENGEVRVLDFGASHQLHRAPWISEFDSARQIPVATPKYASCQLLEGEAADARDDVYALACIAYVLLTGHHPFHDNTALKARTLRMTPKRPSRLSKGQWDTLRAGLHFDREQRPSDMKGWLERLELPGAAIQLPPLLSILTARPPRRTSMRWPVAAVAAVLVLACSWWAAATLGSPGRSVGTSAAALVKSFFAHTVIGDWWDKDHGDAGNAPPVDVNALDPPPARDEAGDNRSNRPESRAAASEPRRGPSEATGAAQHDEVASSAAPAARSALAEHAAPRAPGEALDAGAAQNGNSPHARIELVADSIDVSPTEGMAQVIVRRSRSLRGDAPFSWWTESGTAKPGRDFVAVNSHVEHIENGKTSARLFIPIVSDPARNQSRSFYVVIDQAGEETAVGPRTLTMVTIAPADKGTAER